MLFRIIAICGLLVWLIPYAHALAPVPKQSAIDAKTIESYQKIGAIYGVIKTQDDGYMEFVESKPGTNTNSEGFPAFQIPKDTGKNSAIVFPEVDVPFGIKVDDSYPADFFKELAGLKNLTILIVTSISSIGNSFSELEHAQQLTALRICHTGVTDTILKTVGKIKTLIRLEFGVSKEVTQEGWKQLAGLTELRSFITNYSSLGDKEMKMLGQFSKLVKLKIFSHSISDEGAMELAGLKELEWLVLESTLIRDAGLKVLRNFDKLTRLTLNGMMLTDEGLKEMKGLVNLEELGLESTRVTDIGIRELAGLKKLKFLFLGRTFVTGVGLRVRRSVILDSKNYIR